MIGSGCLRKICWEWIKNWKRKQILSTWCFLLLLDGNMLLVCKLKRIAISRDYLFWNGEGGGIKFIVEAQKGKFYKINFQPRAMRWKKFMRYLSCIISCKQHSSNVVAGNEFSSQANHCRLSHNQAWGETIWALVWLGSLSMRQKNLAHKKPLLGHYAWWLIL